MELEHTFTVPVPVDEAWAVLLDIERIAPCMPGATVDSVTGDDFTGKVKVKVGPITVTYTGKASFTEKDAGAHRVVMLARAKETRGSGTAAATVTATLVPAGAQTEVEVTTDLAITGKPAQFGRGVMADIGAKLIGQFADCLAQELADSGPATDAAAEPAEAGPPPASTPVQTEPGVGVSEAAAPAVVAAAPPAGAATPDPQRREAEPINLLGTAGSPVLKRLAPVAGGLLALILLVRVLRRRG